MSINQNNSLSATTRFSNTANEVLRTGTSRSAQLPFSMPQQYGMMPPPGFGYPPPFASPYPMGFMPPMMMPPINTAHDEDEEFETMIKLIEKQKDILGRFVGTLDKNKDLIVKDRTKDLSKQIKKLEKESVIHQLKLQNEQARLIKKLNAPYEFDPNIYKLSDHSDSSDDDDDDILIEILSNKLNFNQLKDAISKKNSKRKSKSRNTTGISATSKKSKSPKRPSKAASNLDEDEDENSEDSVPVEISKRSSKTSKSKKSKSRKPSKRGDDTE